MTPVRAAAARSSSIAAAAGDRAVAGADQFHVEFFHFLQHLDPRCAIGVPHVVERTIHAGIAGAEDLVLGQIRYRVTGSMSMSQEQELDALRVVFEDVFLV